MWRLHETSRFVKENGQWFYIDGELKGILPPMKKITRSRQKRTLPMRKWEEIQEMLWPLNEMGAMIRTL